MESILVLNCGSSSVKFALYPLGEMSHANSSPRWRGGVSPLQGQQPAVLKWRQGSTQNARPLDGNTHQQAIADIFALLAELDELGSVIAIGHRIVHGGDRFRQPTLLTPTTIHEIGQYSDFAPLHNPSNLLAVQLCAQYLPQLPQIGVFDTAFHASLPPLAFHYPLPLRWLEDHGVRRYGFHGISHHYIATRLPACLKQDASTIRAVSAHLGNGSSLCAIKGQASVDTSMGFTPLEGLMMGSRSGDIDPGLHEYLCKVLNVSVGELTRLLNQEAGLKGVSGLSNDMRDCQLAADSGNQRAALAIELFCYRLAKQIASYTVPLGQINALAFTGGIGENAAPVRARTVQWLEGLGFCIDAAANQITSDIDRPIHAPGSRPVVVIPTREEWMIAHQIAQFIANSGIQP